MMFLLSIHELLISISLNFGTPCTEVLYVSILFLSVVHGSDKIASYREGFNVGTRAFSET
jgi:hypothetical protein